MADEMRKCYPYRLWVALSAAIFITGGMISAFVVPGIMFSNQGFDILDNPIPIGCAMLGGFLFMVSGFLLTGLCNRLYAYGQLHTFYANHASSFVGGVQAPPKPPMSARSTTSTTFLTITPRTPGSATPAKVKIPPWEQTWRNWTPPPPPPPNMSIPPTPEPDMQKCKTHENLFRQGQPVSITLEVEETPKLKKKLAPKRSISTTLASALQIQKCPTFDALPPPTPPILEEGARILSIPQLNLDSLEPLEALPPPPMELLNVKKSKGPKPPKRSPNTVLQTFRAPSPDPLPPPPPELLRQDSTRFDLPSPQPLVVKAQKMMGAAGSRGGYKTLPR